MEGVELDNQDLVIDEVQEEVNSQGDLNPGPDMQENSMKGPEGDDDTETVASPVRTAGRSTELEPTNLQSMMLLLLSKMNSFEQSQISLKKIEEKFCKLDKIEQNFEKLGDEIRKTLEIRERETVSRVECLVSEQIGQQRREINEQLASIDSSVSVNQGRMAAVLLEKNMCASFLSLSAPQSLFSI